MRLLIAGGAFLIVVFSPFHLAAAMTEVEVGISSTNRSESRAPLIPYPQKVRWSNGDLTLRAIYLQYDPSEEKKRIGGDNFSTLQLRPILEQAGIPIVDSPDFPETVRIAFRIGTVPGAETNSEAYWFRATDKKVDIVAPTPKGLFYATQTFRQLIRLENGSVLFPYCEIVDWPAFLYRGFMHDVGRNFQDVELIKRHLDIMAHYKLNLFHFHLSDDPGYRIECKKYPQLNAPENYRPTRQPGKFYTYTQINEIIEYARQRNIQVVPEIDMPGHSEYFRNTFGYDMQDPRGVQVLKDILTEFFEHIDTEFFHMGSDEVEVRNPEFMKELAAFIRGKGRKVIVWRPGHLPDHNVITQLWSERGMAIESVPYWDSKSNYINHMDALDGPICVFFQQPCRVPQGNELALGGILCHWPDNNINTQMDIYQQSPVYPAMVAYAERIWRGASVNRQDCWAKLPAKTDPAFQEFADFERDMIIHRDRFFKELPFPYIKQTDIPWKLIGPFNHGKDPQKSFPVEKSIQDEYSIDGKSYTWTIGYGGTIHINHFFGFPGHLPSAPSGTAYALTYIYSKTNQEVDFWIGFNGFSRAGGRRGGPSPQQGQWSNAYSKIWINDEPISPPVWKNPGMKDSPEVPFVDEDYFYRQPTKVHLKKGWNKLLVKAPKESPAWKWMFTCVPVRCKEGRCREADDLIFSIMPQECRN